MALKETKLPKNMHERLTAPETTNDDTGEESLRPKKLTEYIGQTMIKKHLQVALDAAKVRGTALEHILFYGPPGLGKTTLAMLVSYEMGSNLRHTS